MVRCLLEQIADGGLQFLDVGANLGSQHVMGLLERHQRARNSARSVARAYTRPLRGSSLCSASRRDINFKMPTASVPSVPNNTVATGQSMGAVEG